MQISPSISAMLPCFLAVPNRMINRNKIANHTITDIRHKKNSIDLFIQVPGNSIPLVRTAVYYIPLNYDVVVTYAITFLKIAVETAVLP